MKFPPRWSKNAAFSLVELLVVIGIAGIVLSLTVMAFSQIQGAQRLSRAGMLLQDQLRLARQLAITGNAPVVFSLCETDGGGGDAAFNTILLSRVLPDGSTEPVSRPLRFPAGFSISEDEDWSSLMTRSAATVALPSGSVPCRQIRFGASGSSDLDVSREWFLTVSRHVEADGAPPDNFITLVIDPATGRTFSYQP